MVQISELTSEAGCDSIIVTTVNPIEVSNQEVNIEVCSGESYTFPDGSVKENITEQVVHTSELTSEAGCDSIIVTTVNPIEVYNETETVEVCSGGSYTFPDSTVKDSITAQVVHASNLTSYAGCDSIIVTTVTPIEIYNETETTEVCSGESYTFPDSTVKDSITAQVVHTSNLTSQAGCDSIIVTTVNPILVDTSVTVEEPKLTSNAVGAQYQWINCGDSSIIAGATDQAYTTSANGDYAVIVTVGECSDTSACYVVTTIGIVGSVFGATVSTYPNPVSEQLTINFGKKMEKVRVDITSVIGQVVCSSVFENSFRINLPLNAPSGTYFVRLISGEEALTFKIVKE